MKKFLFITLTALFACVLAGCDTTDNKVEYKIMVYGLDSIRISREPYMVEQNRLYQYLHEEIRKINNQYEGQTFDDERKAIEAYDESVSQIKALNKSLNDSIESGRDYGASEFIINGYSIMTKDLAQFRKSETFRYMYTSNVRIECQDEIRINTVAESVNGTKPVVISDEKNNVRIIGYTLYNEYGEVSTAKLIDDVIVSQDTVDKTVFEVSYKAEQGVDAGNFYLLVTFQNVDDSQKAIFDLKIDVIHTTIR